ncbi:MAG: hypothetical protein AB7F43_07130 [Bacteriovoracia bacterium]
MNVVFAGLFLASCAGYWFTVFWDLWPHPFFGLLALLSIQFLLYAIMIARIHTGTGMRFTTIFGIAVVARVILWFSSPILENDYWRYLWDGRVLAHGINPYLYVPLNSALNVLDAPYRGMIGWSQFNTIYPPLAQILFAAQHIIAPDSLLALKVLFTAFDLGTGWILYLWILKLGRNPAWTLLYLLNPLVLKEIANSAHLDSVPVFFTTLSLFLFTNTKKRSTAWVSLALGICSKLYPLVLVPLFIRVDPRWKKHLTILILIVTGLYLPFIGAGTKLFGGTGAYATYWIFNASIFQLVTLVLKSVLGSLSAFSENTVLKEALINDFPAKILLGFVFLILLFWRVKKVASQNEIPAAALWILGLVLVVSPVVDAWYVLWLLPLACLLGNAPWICFSYLVVASYSWLYSKELAPFFRFTEYSIFFILGYLHFKNKWLDQQAIKT